ncbi:MAG: SusC/RagA family TonB-linked outer membrane protein [Bacteroidaceae bacterium]|nr:SusC/RagA family TonB-linked outer membrane protein [Bacteroidaceae bacterium]MBR1789376.1 SusC/RagA family TonB-linked outer membrane protein [Bacteroidaceae bacterium]
MKNIRYILLFLCAILPLGAWAQQIKTVHGNVSDEWGELPGVQVCEIDGSGRIIEATVTDANGNFTMRVRNPKDRIRFSHVGCKPQTFPINRAKFQVTMNSSTTLKEVTVKGQKRLNAGGLSIPEREISFAAQSISMEEFEGLGLTTVDEALQGRIAGLDIVAVSGNLGAGTQMRLRGGSSISTLTSQNPLIVVNGNTWNVDMSNFDVNTANDEQFAQLLNVNPEDIEKITVLKDAAATAIYGSQGSNGVIEITTKRGKRGAPRLSYSLRLTGTYQPRGYKLLNGDEYTMLLKESYFNPEQNDAASNIRELNYDPTFSEYEQYNNNTDWVDAVTKFGLRQNHYLSVTGGGEKATFRIAGGYDHETGSVIEQKLDRFSTRVALDYYVSSRIKISTDLAFTYTKNQKNYDDLLSVAYKKMPNMSIYEQDPVTGRNTPRYYNMLQSAPDVFSGDQRSYVNPVASAHLAKNKDRTYDINPQLELNYKLLGTDDDHHQLNWQGRVYMNIFNEYVDMFYPKELVTLAWNNGVNNASMNSSKSVAFNTKQTLTYIPAFQNKDHSLMAMARMELVSGSSNGQGTDATKLPSGGITIPTAGGRVTGMSSSFNQWRSIYYTFSTHYAYKSRYMFDFSLRADGSTKFGPGRRWGFFPAVSLRWNIVDEKFMEPTRKWLSMLAVRPSWGRVGGQPSREYLFASIYSSDTRYIDMGAIKPENIRIADLRWETNTTYDLGFDLGLFDDRLTLQAEWYYATRRDMLMEGVAIPSSSGYYNLSYQNVGSMRNIGWELNFNTNKLIKKGKFYMDLNMVFANNSNEILSMNETVLNSLNSKFTYENREILQRVQLHNPFGSIYGFRYKGVYEYQYETFQAMTPSERDAFLAAGHTAPVAFSETGELVLDEEGDPVRMMYNYTQDGTGKNYKFNGGDAIYEDINHDGQINALDIVYLGSSLPKLTGGFGFTLHYGNWKLNTQFNYRVGNKILNMARLDAEAMVNNDNQSKAVNYRWRKEGDVTPIPRAMYGGSSNYNTLVSDRFVENGSFLRLNYIQLSYSCNAQALKKTLGISGLRFYASANNLFILTKYKGVDPEISYGGYGAAVDIARTPRAKSYTLGVTVDF